MDEAGQVRHAASAAHEDVRMDRPLWAEQRPENWWDATRQAVRGVLTESKVTGKDIRGVGLSGQMHGLVMLDASNQVIRPALIWSDQRSQPQVDWINQTIGKEAVLRYTANPVLTGFTLPKLLWVRDNEPRNFERVKKMLLPKDYIRFQLTGDFASDVSDASGTALFDVVQRRWSFEMVDALKLDRGMLARVYESSEVTGVITEAAARETGLAAGYAGCGWRRRSGLQRRRQRNRRYWRGLLHHRNLRRRVRAQRQAAIRSGRPRAHVLPRGERRMARDGRHARRRLEPAVVPQSTGSRRRITTR